MSLSKLKNFFRPPKFLSDELISTNEKFLFDLRYKLTHGDRSLNETETKKLFTSRKYFNNDIFLSGIKNHVLEFNNFKNQIMMKIFGFDNKKGGFSLINVLIYLGITFGLVYSFYENEINEIFNRNEEDKKDKNKTVINDNEDDDNFLMKLVGVNNNFNVNFAKDLKERLDNVKGINEVKDEIEQLIRMIKEPDKFRDAGAKLHKGILLCGKPGTGKTLVARAIAGESGVNFIYLTGSDFDEVFVGVGATRVRKLFRIARKNTPCIIFIDEIDSLLTKSRRMSMEHSSSRATINQFLSEMDGFDKMENVFVIGATNHEKDLDSAAVRPGRFDKKIHINIPDENGRLEIIEFYLSKIKLNKDKIDPKIVAKMTPGFTGAEIQNLVNMSIINAINEEKNEVTIEDVGEARDRILMGISKKNFVASDLRRYSTSLHEAGHTLVCYLNPICKKTLHKLTIIPRGPAEGVTFMLPNEDAIENKEEFLSAIDTAMGGHVAEELVFGKENTRAGCSSDLNKATKMAEVMVKNFGMYNTSTGYIYIDENTDQPEKVSENYKSKIDETIKIILKDSHDRVYDLLKQHANDLKNISQKVFQYDTLTVEEIELIIQGKGDEISKPIVRKPYQENSEINYHI